MTSSELNSDEVERLSDEAGICRECGCNLPDELLRYSIEFCEMCAGIPSARTCRGCGNVVGEPHAWVCEVGPLFFDDRDLIDGDVPRVTEEEASPA